MDLQATGAARPEAPEAKERCQACVATRRAARWMQDGTHTDEYAPCIGRAGLASLLPRAPEGDRSSCVFTFVKYWVYEQVF
jgi:hypothetical protein